MARSGQPGILCGYSLVTNNYYNGSPSGGAAVGFALQNSPQDRRPVSVYVPG